MAELSEYTKALPVANVKLACIRDFNIDKAIGSATLQMAQQVSDAEYKGIYKIRAQRLFAKLT